MPKIKNIPHTQVLEPQPTAPSQIPQAKEEIQRIVRRLRSLLLPHFQSATRMGTSLGPDDLRAAVAALLAEADGLSPDPHLHCPDPIQLYLRRTMYEELLEEPSNIFFTTRVRSDVIRYEAMPRDFWKQCLMAFQAQFNRNLI